MADTKATEVETTEQAKPVTESFDEKVTKFVTEEYGKAAAAESASESTEQPAEAQAAAQPEKPGETATDTKAEEPFTDEQLSDPKFWDGLKEDGWNRAAKLHPVETARVKAAYKAAGRIAEEARQRAQKPAVDTASEPAKPAQPSAELQDAIRRANSLDEKEAATGLQDIVKLTVLDMAPALGLDPVQAKATNVARTAYAAVVASTPEILQLDPQQLDAVVVADPVLTNMLEIAAPLPDDISAAITANVMRKAVEVVMTKQKADATAKAASDAAKIEKQKVTQRKVNSNATNVSNVIVESPSGGAPKGKKTVEEFVQEKYAEALAAEGR